MISVHEDQWLSGVFGHGVFRIEAGADVPSETTVVGSLQRHAAGRAAASYYARVPTDNVALLRALCAAGMYVVDVNVTFRRPANGVTPSLEPPAPGCTVHDIAPEHHAEVLDIAGSCFRYSRFHLDPRIPLDIADRIKREWIGSYLRKQRGERLLVALRDDKPAGFLAVLSSEIGGRRVRIIDLIGVAKPAQGQRIGRTLMNSFIERYRDDSDELCVGTQIANVPSCRLYQGAGFSLARSAYVVHMHVGISRQGES